MADLVVDLVETLVPEMERLGVASAAEIGLATLAERMDNEVNAESVVLVGRSEIGAWSRT